MLTLSDNQNAPEGNVAHVRRQQKETRDQTKPDPGSRPAGLKMSRAAPRTDQRTHDLGVGLCCLRQSWIEWPTCPVEPFPASVADGEFSINHGLFLHRRLVWRRVDPLFQTINLIREEHPNRCCAPSNAMAKAIDERSQPSIHSRSDFPSESHATISSTRPRRLASTAVNAQSRPSKSDRHHARG